MAEPADKSPETTEFLDRFTQTAFGRTRSESIRADVCVYCGGPATEFNDEVSRREYRISGYCQKCQDATFGEDD